MKKILVIDDSLEIHDVIKGYLAQESIEIINANNGTEGFKKAKENKDLSLFIIDYHMPDITGLDLTERLRGDEEFARIPIMIFTTERDKEIVSRGRKVKRLYWGLKPMNKDSFLKTVSLLLQKEI